MISYFLDTIYLSKPTIDVKGCSIKVLITGVAGFIGFHLAQRLVQLEHEIIGIDNLNDYYDIALKHERLATLGIDSSHLVNQTANSSSYPYLTFIKLDICDNDALTQLFKNHHFDAVIHLAAQAGIRYSFKFPETYVQVNMVGSFNIFELCKKHQIAHTIYASSSSVYGNTTSDILSTSESSDTPLNMYAASKKSMELMAHSYASLNNMKITGLRFFTVYGPWGRPDMAPMMFAKSIQSQETITLFNHGEMYRDFTYIDDIIDGITLILSTPFEGNYNLFNIGNSSPVYLKDFVEIMQEKLSKKAKIKYLPMQKGEAYKTYADITPMKELFGFSPKIDIDEGLTHFINWYIDYYKDDICVE